MINNENYIVIQGFMVNELHLKGNELLVYAIIYGFSQLKNQKFTGSLQYLANWTNSTKQGIQKNLKSLLSKGLIAKEDRKVNGINFVVYYTTELHTLYNSVSWGIQHSCTNNIDNNIDIITTTETENNAFKFYENNFGLITPYIAENINTYLADGLSEELIIKTMKEAVESNVRRWSYVKPKLNDCLNNNIYTIEQYNAKETEFKNNKINKTTTTKPKEIKYNTDFSEYDEYAKRNR